MSKQIIIVVFDNTVQPNDVIREVIGDKGFGDAIVKKKNLEKHFREHMENIFENFRWMVVNNLYDIAELVKDLAKWEKESNVHILHCFSNHVVMDREDAALTFQKLPYIESPILLISDKSIAGMMFDCAENYVDFLKKVLQEQSTTLHMAKECGYEELKFTGMKDISDVNSFMHCIAGDFDTRYFNSIAATDFRVTKSSDNKKKIQSEYTFYQLLPEKMKPWFVMPFSYCETEKTASYEMERLYMTDVAIKWVHGAIGQEEFSQLMDIYFYFFREREQKDISKEQYRKQADALYVEKVISRIEDLKQEPAYQKIAQIISADDRIKSIDDIVNRYFCLKEKVERRIAYESVSVIGHGDPCFANTMYNRATRMLKFIDPRGALTEEELWTNPYYDVAKLSHSVCGNYDFFNNAMFDISIDENLCVHLEIPFDNSPYKKIFRTKVEQNGFDYLSVRLYEASLFLSMLPLHMDYPQKVLGFLLNAVNILDEVEADV
jgi:hypothetical protein